MKDYYLIVGQAYHATWKDGATAIGTFTEAKSGYFILKDKEGKNIVCHPSHVKFRKISSIFYCEVCECDPCDCYHNKS